MSAATEPDWNASEPCPPWCTLPDRHGYDSDGPDGTMWRVHEPAQPLTNRAAAVLVPEWRSVDGTVTVGPAAFTLEWTDSREGTSAEAQELAADLLAIAATIDQINAASTSRQSTCEPWCGTHENSGHPDDELCRLEFDGEGSVSISLGTQPDDQLTLGWSSEDYVNDSAEARKFVNALSSAADRFDEIQAGAK